MESWITFVGIMPGSGRTWRVLGQPGVVMMGVAVVDKEERKRIEEAVKSGKPYQESELSTSGLYALVISGLLPGPAWVFYMYFVFDDDVIYSALFLAFPGIFVYFVFWTLTAFPLSQMERATFFGGCASLLIINLMVVFCGCTFAT